MNLSTINKLFQEKSVNFYNALARRRMPHAKINIYVRCCNVPLACWAAPNVVLLLSNAAPVISLHWVILFIAGRFCYCFAFILGDPTIFSSFCAHKLDLNLENSHVACLINDDDL